METAPVQYAIVDGAVEEGLLDFLNEVNPPHCCLYAEPIQLDLVALAPISWKSFRRLKHG